jgi:hypothetical protein
MSNQKTPRYVRAGEHVSYNEVFNSISQSAKEAYPLAFSQFLPLSFDLSEKRKLTMDRKTWTLKDRRTGTLSQPVRLSEWPECTYDDARHEVARHIWAKACRMENLLKFGSISIDTESGKVSDPNSLL